MAESKWVFEGSDYSSVTFKRQNGRINDIIQYTYGEKVWTYKKSDEPLSDQEELTLEALAKAPYEFELTPALKEEAGLNKERPIYLGSYMGPMAGMGNPVLRWGNKILGVIAGFALSPVYVLAGIWQSLEWYAGKIKAAKGAMQKLGKVALLLLFVPGCIVGNLLFAVASNIIAGFEIGLTGIFKRGIPTYLSYEDKEIVYPSKVKTPQGWLLFALNRVLGMALNLVIGLIVYPMVLALDLAILSTLATYAVEAATRVVGLISFVVGRISKWVDDLTANKLEYVEPVNAKLFKETDLYSKLPTVSLPKCCSKERGAGYGKLTEEGSKGDGAGSEKHAGGLEPDPRDPATSL